jgi:hypothetical protein
MTDGKHPKSDQMTTEETVKAIEKLMKRKKKIRVARAMHELKNDFHEFSVIFIISRKINVN